MKTCVIVGAPGVGKTTLFGRLTAELNGGRGISPAVGASSGAAPDDPGGGGSRYTSDENGLPRGLLDSAGASWVVYDTPGMPDEISASRRLREAAGATLRLLMHSDAIIHVLDASRVGKHGAHEGLTEVDRALQRLIRKADWEDLRGSIPMDVNGFARPQGLRDYLARLLGCRRDARRGLPPRHIVVANKMDLPWAQVGRMDIQTHFASTRVIPMSAGRGEGIRLTWRRVCRG